MDKQDRDDSAARTTLGRTLFPSANSGSAKSQTGWRFDAGTIASAQRFPCRTFYFHNFK